MDHKCFFVAHSCCTLKDKWGHMHTVSPLLSEIIHSCLLLLKQTNLSLQPECSHNLPLHYKFLDKYDAVMKMQYMLFYSPALCVSPPSPQLLLYCNSPNTSYAMSRLVNFKLPLLKPFFHRMSVSYAEFIQCSLVLPTAASWNLSQSEVCFRINHKQSVP